MAVGQDFLFGRLVDLHLHVDGSVSVAMARRLSELGGQPLALSDEELFERLSVGEECEDLNEYLDKFTFPLALLQTYEQIEESVFLLQEELKARGLAYAELRFAPQSQCERGLSQREVVEASLAGLARSAFEARLILCCMRGADNHAANLETIELAAEYLGRGVVAADLAGAEALFPTEDFSDLFARARELGVPFTIHAGEADGPASVRAALAMGAVRIGHGVRAAQNDALVAELASRGVTLEVCPTSEVQTGAIGAMDSPALRQLLRAGVPVAVCSDNMAVSNTWVGREMELLADAFDLGEREVRRLLECSVEAAFCDDETKARLRRIVLR